MNPIRQAIEALSAITERGALYFGEQHNTVIEGRAALSALQSLQGVELPPLPEPYTELYKDLTPVLYEAWSQQMQAYARTAVAAAMARGAVARVKDDMHWQDVELLTSLVNSNRIAPSESSALFRLLEQATQPDPLEKLTRLQEDMGLYDEATQPDPIDMVLYCPNCGKQHIDAPEPGKLISGGPNAGRVRAGWNNPTHRSHLCHSCGCIWRPADVPTNGVAHIETKGKADTWIGKAPFAAPAEATQPTQAEGRPCKVGGPCVSTATSLCACRELPPATQPTQAEAASTEGLLKRASRALMIAEGALIEVSPCAEEGCRQHQTDIMRIAEEECAAVRVLIEATLATQPTQAEAPSVTTSQTVDDLIADSERERKSAAEWQQWVERGGYDGGQQAEVPSVAALFKEAAKNIYHADDNGLSAWERRNVRELSMMLKAFKAALATQQAGQGEALAQQERDFMDESVSPAEREAIARLHRKVRR